MTLARGLAANTVLTSLSLSRNHVGNDGAAALARAIDGVAQPASALRLLSLCDAEVEEPGAEALKAALAVNSVLVELDFASNPCLDTVLASLHPRVRVQ
jgi:hypothetical protein